MSVPQLSVELRDQSGKGAARKLRAEGLVPGVFYGPGVEPQSLSLDPAVLRKLMTQSPSRTFLLDLKIGDQVKKAMLKQVQVHPVTRNILHADFYSVADDRPVTLDVFIKFVGEPVGVEKGGVAELRTRFVPLKGLPGVLPAEVEADISGLDIGDSFKVSDLEIGEGIEPLVDEDTVLCAVAAPRIIELEAETGEEAEEAEGEAGAGSAEGEKAESAEQPESSEE